MVPRNAAAPGSNRGEQQNRSALATREDDITSQCGCTRPAGDFWSVDSDERLCQECAVNYTAVGRAVLNLKAGLWYPVLMLDEEHDDRMILGAPTMGYENQ